MVSKMNSIKIIKRDGREKSFNSTRIRYAIDSASLEVGKYNENDTLGVDIAEYIEDYLEDNHIECIGVEEVQDLVIERLKVEDIEVANAYQKYREEREEKRIKNSKKEDFYKEVLECTNVDNDNANVDQHSFSGRKYRITDYEQKQYALRNLISKEGKKAFENGSIYYHDLSAYAVGDYNCMNLKIDEGLKNGFKTRNGDVRGSNSITTACQLIAVMFQCESQVQFGGVGASCIDFQVEDEVKKSFRKHFINGLKYTDNIPNLDDSIKKIKKDLLSISDDKYKNISEKAYNYAKDMLEIEGKQAFEGLFHNLNTLESRAGSQLPFTSINTGRNISPEGRLINKWIFNASINGIGKQNKTSIFPISIFQYKKGINAHKGDKNYDIKKLAIKSLCRRIYPNIANGDYKQVVENPNDYNTFFATMGCVDGQEMVTYKYNNETYVESFERMWNRLSKYFKIKEQNTKDNYYIDLKGVLIFDTKEGFVDCKRIIKNSDKGDWVQLKFTKNKSLLATQDHPLPIINKGRTFVKDLMLGDKIEINNKGSIEEAELISYKNIGYLNNPSYDVTTSSDHFEVSGIYSHNCRTMMGYDRFTGEYTISGRGNLSPITIILPKLGLDYGIKLGQRDKADVNGFFKELNKVSDLVAEELVRRTNYMMSQSPKSAPFIYDNNLVLDADKSKGKDNVVETLKHGTNAVGILGMAECCIAMFGKHHGESVEAYKFALKIVRLLNNKCKEYAEQYDLNFGLYFTPAENLCKTAVNMLKLHYGEIEGVTDKKYLTNSIHIPVYFQIDAYTKIALESPFTQYGTAGCITYVEMDNNSIRNQEGIEQLIDYAMDMNIPYFAINFPINTCLDCGTTYNEDNNKCPNCGSSNIEMLKRVTGYITGNYKTAFNEGKQQEAEQRVVHTIFNPDTIPVLRQAYKELKEMNICEFEETINEI